MNPYLLQSLAKIFTATDINPAYEHRAIHSDNVGACVGRMLQEGYTLKKEGVPAFLQRENDRVEVIERTTPEHVAYAVGDKGMWGKLYRRFEESDDFVPLGGPSFKDWLQHTLFKHKESGEVVQLIWRSEQIFDGVSIY